MPNKPHDPTSPWDDEPVISSAPVPTTPEKAASVKGMLPSWLGRPIVHPDHANDLETEAAINEYGLKMPRAQAEDQAHKDYVGKQREAAASHHLSGMKVANATGDTEAARKHHMMYSLHAKALGFEPVGEAPASIADKHVYKLKFKPHQGDMFSASEPAKPEPDAIMGGYKGPSKEVSKKTPLTSAKSLNDHLMGKSESFKAHAADVYAVIDRKEVPEKPQLTKSQSDKLFKILSDSKVLLAKAEVRKCAKCGKPAVKAAIRPGADEYVCTDGHKSLMQRKEEAKKGEMSPTKSKTCGCEAPVKEDLKKKPRPCICLAYPHPHRTGGGKCQAKK